MFEEFKKAMTREFEMTDIGLMSYYLGIEVKQKEYGVFISQEGYARELLKKFKMNDCKPISTPIECGVKLSKYDEGEPVDATSFKSLVGSLRYLTYTRPNILYAVGLVSRYMKAPITTHLKTAKIILRYIKCFELCCDLELTVIQYRKFQVYNSDTEKVTIDGIHDEQSAEKRR
ncbi:hypothetical protein EZV62_023776 [Acer yangbiense]|uniref:Reverse transcriptase Ty1/copia-type domain-containing protein n=1 Tax=Acer yangbiense TaxID=1000413 RepID=A0A5C7H4B3_9ROSI|nr:hypothetical protein EZV62_023776 [Acer yangbiense]